MRKEELWAVSLERAQTFFRNQPEVTTEEDNAFAFRSCRISLTELPSNGTGFWAAKRIRLCIEGEAADVDAIYRRFFLQFLSAGG